MIFSFQLKNKTFILGGRKSSLRGTNAVPKKVVTWPNWYSSYYPFGLTMAGISSKAAGKLENKNKFNGGSEQVNDLNIGMYETVFRGLDAQTGRWWQIDPMAEINLSISPYSYVNNNPISYFDPFGLDSVKVAVNNGQTNVTATNADGSRGTYTINGNNIEGTGMGGSSEVTVTSSKKSKSVLSAVSLAGGYLSLLNDSYEHSGQLQHSIDLLKSGKFEAFYKGELQTWKLGFKGNGSVPSQLVNIQKDNFLKVVANNAKMLEFIKRGGVVLNAAGVGLTLIDMKVKGVNAENSTDLVVGMIAFVPGGGWIVSSLYFMGKESGFNKGVEFVGDIRMLNEENKDNLMWHLHE